jgi:translation initiation factor 2 alpha subunit (eIF-2alpha)
MTELKEGDLVLCTVTQLGKTTVFVKIEGDGEGTIVTSEIAPGRIRNLRDYVIPNKRIVCKVLRIDGNNINLSLRRVSPKEHKEIMELHEKERNSLSILRSVLKEKAEQVAEKIKQESSLHEFLQNCRTNPKQLEKYLQGGDAERICKILQEKKEKQIEIKKEFKLSSKKPNGIKIIKETLSVCHGNCDISYLAAGRYVIKMKSDDYKKANQQLNSILEKIEKLAKEKKSEFEEKK